MFQQIFRAQDGDLMLWPLVAMALFVAVFAAQIWRILRAPASTVDAQARLPLDDDALPSNDRRAEAIRGDEGAKP